MRVRVLGVSALVFCMASVVFGACGDNPVNLMRFSNCGFDVDTSGWTLVIGDLLVHHPNEGYWEPGAAYVEPVYYPQLPRYDLELNSPCVSVANFTEYHIGAYVKALGEMTCGVSLFEYSDTNCNNWLSGSGSSLFTSFGDWVLVENRHTTGSTTQGARLRFWCNDASAFQALLDDAFIVPGGVIFVDGFESGSTAAWSVTAP